MNKKILIGIIVTAIILVVSILVIVFVNQNKSATDSNINKIDEGAKQEEVTDGTTGFWISSYNFQKTTKDFNLNLYNGFVKIPIDLEEFEEKVDNFNYRAAKEGEYRNTEQTVSKIKDITANLDDGEKLQVYLESDEETFSKISSFTIENFGEETMTAQECIENGWWYFIDYSESGLSPKIFGINKIISKDASVLEEIISNLGKPTHIYSISNEDLTINDSGMGIAMYNIIYEYSTFVITLQVNEWVNTKTHDATCTIDNLGYFTKQSWEKYSEEYSSEGEAYNNHKDLLK